MTRTGDPMGNAGQDRDEAVLGFALLGLLAAGATNAAVAVLEDVVWAWCAAGSCLLAALLCGLAWGTPDDAGPDWEPGRGIVVGEAEVAALVHRER
ncbi:hypothetical protein ACIGNX_30465 [Actinosynnema sp. NPDC053489]|uniref:hypothetical protein n=1 Tax=Actinosynnema sp. NPDC053489 TaxID=3363916 RepID=UPI0037C58D73